MTQQQTDEQPTEAGLDLLAEYVSDYGLSISQDTDGRVTLCLDEDVENPRCFVSEPGEIEIDRLVHDLQALGVLPRSDEPAEDAPKPMVPDEPAEAAADDISETMGTEERIRQAMEETDGSDPSDG